METVRIFDTTLRDGEQSPARRSRSRRSWKSPAILRRWASISSRRGFRSARKAISNPCRRSPRRSRKSVVCGLARCDAQGCRARGRSGSRRAQIAHPYLLRHLQDPSRSQAAKGKEEIIRISVESIRLARQYTDDVEFSPEDASRTELEFLEEITQAAVEAGATTINLPDTVGYATPKTYGEIFSHLLKKLPILRERNIILSSHCHDDLGMAVANSLSAVENGARQIECTINGIGERAGNAAMEEIVMALRTRSDYYKIGTRIDASEDLSGQPDGQHADRSGRAAQQGDRRRERLRPRVRHSSGRHAEISRDVRDHGPGVRRHSQIVAGARQTFAAGMRSATASCNSATR